MTNKLLFHVFTIHVSDYVLYINMIFGNGCIVNLKESVYVLCVCTLIIKTIK